MVYLKIGGKYINATLDSVNKARANNFIIGGAINDLNITFISLSHDKVTTYDNLDKKIKDILNNDDTHIYLELYITNGIRQFLTNDDIISGDDTCLNIYNQFKDKHDKCTMIDMRNSFTHWIPQTMILEQLYYMANSTTYDNLNTDTLKLSTDLEQSLFYTHSIINNIKHMISGVMNESGLLTIVLDITKSNFNALIKNCICFHELFTELETKKSGDLELLQRIMKNDFKNILDKYFDQDDSYKETSVYYTTQLESLNKFPNDDIYPLFKFHQICEALLMDYYTIGKILLDVSTNNKKNIVLALGAQHISSIKKIIESHFNTVNP